MTSLQLFAKELGITVTNPEVWLAISLALLVGAVCLLVGTVVARVVGLLARAAPAGETIGVGLATGLILLAVWWAALWSGGRSSFTPVAAGSLIALALAVARRRRAPTRAGSASARADPARYRHVAGLAAMGALFVVAIALLYGSTVAPSPRDGEQPIEFVDVAFYAVLGDDLADTGREANYLPSGFSHLPGVPNQTWYHWGELWLASAMITIFGSAPMAARYFVVLPLVLLAAAALTGTIVQRLTRSASRAAYLWGFVACLFLAPMPVVPGGPFFGSWAVGLIFGITLYGLGAVAVLYALYCLVRLRDAEQTWALAFFVGTAVAFILPAHLVMAVLAFVAVGVVWTMRGARSIRHARPFRFAKPSWLQTAIVAGILAIATLAWGRLMDHGVAGSATASRIPPFNASWAGSIAIMVLGAGALAAIPIAWFLARRRRNDEAELYLGTLGLLGFGALAWGARAGDFNMYHVLFAGIAAFAPPAAAVAIWRLRTHLLAAGRRRLAVAVVALCALQLEVGAITSLARLESFGPHHWDQPISVAMLEEIRRLPPDAKLAYGCRPLDESGFADPTLGSIDAHTGRTMVPMCFQADYLGTLIGGELSFRAMNPSFIWAPQRALYPNLSAIPRPSEVATFLKSHGIHYVYTDRIHGNRLVDGAILIAEHGGAQLLRVP
jgi:hypothetical protein